MLNVAAGGTASSLDVLHALMVKGLRLLYLLFIQ
jgi:hypothetical protein